MKRTKLTLVFLFVLACNTYLLAQPGPPPNPTPLPGLAWLVVAGAALGAKKAFNKKREARNQK